MLENYSGIARFPCENTAFLLYYILVCVGIAALRGQHADTGGFFSTNFI